MSYSLSITCSWPCQRPCQQPRFQIYLDGLLAAVSKALRADGRVFLAPDPHDRMTKVMRRGGGASCPATVRCYAGWVIDCQAGLDPPKAS